MPATFTVSTLNARSFATLLPSAEIYLFEGICKKGLVRARFELPAFSALLRAAGITVIETTLRYSDFQTADEIFSTGNYSKVVPVIRIGDRSLEFGPVYAKARELYWAFAHSSPVQSKSIAGIAVSPGS